MFRSPTSTSNRGYFEAVQQSSENIAKKVPFEYDKLIFFVNGKQIIEERVDPRTTLATYLRDHLKLTGTKVGCNEGGCGACTIVISDLDPKTEKIRHYSANSCLTPVCAVFGKVITTVEGIGTAKNMHPIQERLAIAHGTQCGYCTPGFVMAMYSLLKNTPRPSLKEIDTALQGNLCRCTGYRPILEAFYTFTEQPKESQRSNSTVDEERRKEFTTLSSYEFCKEYYPENEIDYSLQLQNEDLSKKSFYMRYAEYTWYQPNNLQDLLTLKKQFPYARLVSGNSEIGVERKIFFKDVHTFISTKEVPQLRHYDLNKNDGVLVGSGLTINEMKNVFHEAYEKLEQKGKLFKDFTKMLHWFAGNHIRNTATIAGNIATASPTSDFNPIWMAANASVILCSENRGERTVPIDSNFFTDYRKTVILPDEVITSVWIPHGKETDFFWSYKQAQRREDDITIVTGAFYADIDSHEHIIKKLRIAYACMAPKTKMALSTMKALEGRKWDKETLKAGLEKLSEELTLSPGTPGGMERFRQTLALTGFFKFFCHVAQQLKIPHFENIDLPNITNEGFPRRLNATQIYQDVPPNQLPLNPVGRPLGHAAGEIQTTGEALYTTDVYPTDPLYMALIPSPIAAGKLVSLDFSVAVKVHGVKGTLDHNDITNGAMIGHAQDTPIFVKDKIAYHCQPLGAVLADDPDTARVAANLVKVNCIKETPILTTEQAIQAGSYLSPKPFLIRSDLAPNYNDHDGVTKDWTKYDHIMEGTIKIGGQEHFYLEPQNCVVIPGEADEYEIIAATQGIKDVQTFVAQALGVPQHKINVRTKRLGGGFGGKETAPLLFAVPAAVAAKKMRRPIKFVAERYDDMAISGTRHPYMFNYKLGLDKDGKVQNFETTFYANCGHTYDLSVGVLQRALCFADNAYRFPNAVIKGMLCKTNLSSCTALRGFGGPQAMFATETMMLQAAEEFDFDINELREKNFYKEGECTPFGMRLENCNIKRCWDECMEISDYLVRSKDVKDFNKSSKYLKRGIYIVPTKFAIGFGIPELNQAGSLVHVYQDGSVLISHGGVEMGQGLHTKMIQIAANCLGIDVSKITTKETNGDKVPNASATAASYSSDLYGLAIMDACSKINNGLEPLRQKFPNLTWEELVNKAYYDRIPLFSSGFATTPFEPVDFSTGRGGRIFNYCVYGAACSEVEVDCLTGDHRLLRVDIVMDVGESLNPAIDIGQIEGGFVQGYGLFTMEELKVQSDGTRLTRGPGTYKIPTAEDVPRDFNVKLLKGSSNKRAIFSSKAIGEPPLFLGSSAFFAIREAVKAYRKQNGREGYFRFDSPASAERIRMSCEDSLTEKVPKLPPANEYIPWTVEL